jgi:hypothetical protein
MVQLSPLASTILISFFLLSTVILLALIAGIGLLVWKLNHVLERYEERIGPVLDRVDNALLLVTEKTESIGEKTEVLLEQTVETAGSVHQRIDKTAHAIQQTIHAPIININSVATAFAEGFATFRSLQRASQRKSPSLSPVTDSHLSDRADLAEIEEMPLESETDTLNRVEEYSSVGILQAEEVTPNRDTVFPAPVSPSSPPDAVPRLPIGATVIGTSVTDGNSRKMREMVENQVLSQSR